MTKCKKRRPIKVGMLVSYDYERIKNSLPPIYEYADKIVLAADKDGKTWAGNDITVSDEFWQWIKDIDIKQKIEIYRDSFFVEGLTTMQCDTRERTMLAKYMGDGGWHVQLDADEYFIDFKHFADFLHYLDVNRPCVNTVTVEWLSLFKKTPNGFLLLETDDGYMDLATTTPFYSIARCVTRPRAVLYSRRVIHDSWARTEEEAWKKFTNWGHNTDFDIEAYFDYWKAINEKNYKLFRIPNMLNNNLTYKLDYMEGKNIHELLQNIKSNESLITAHKKPGKLTTFIKLCIPPIFYKLKNRIFTRKSIR